MANQFNFNSTEIFDFVKNRVAQEFNGVTMYDLLTNHGIEIVDKFASELFQTITALIKKQDIMEAATQFPSMQSITALQLEQNDFSRMILNIAVSNVMNDVWKHTEMAKTLEQHDYTHYGFHVHDAVDLANFVYNRFHWPEGWTNEVKSILFASLGNMRQAHKNAFVFSDTLWLCKPKYVGRSDSRGRPNTRPALVHLCRGHVVIRRLNVDTPRFRCKDCKEHISDRQKTSYTMMTKIEKIDWTV